jgi:hypothetical protein
MPNRKQGTEGAASLGVKGCNAINILMWFALPASGLAYAEFTFVHAESV